MAYKAPCPPPLPLITITSSGQSFEGSNTNMKPLFWTKIAPSSKNTVWQKVSEQQKLMTINEDKLISLFQRKGDCYKMRCSSPVIPMRILNDKKFQAIQILLRNISWEDILHLMESLNYAKQCSFDVDCLSNVATMITPTELKKLKSSSNNDFLEQPERLFEIENFREKVKCLQYMSQYHDMLPVIKSQLEALEIAYKSLHKPNDKLCKVLALILLAGNKMNAFSTSRRNAYGIKLDILSELKDVRSSDGSSNLMEFIVQSYQDNHLVVTDNNDITMEFPLPKDSQLIPASSVNLIDLKNNCKTLESEMQVCKKGCFQICRSDNFHKEAMVFLDESFKDLANISKKIYDLERLFDEITCFYCLEGQDYKTTSEEFLHCWISFIQSFSKYWDKSIKKNKTDQPLLVNKLSLKSPKHNSKHNSYSTSRSVSTTMLTASTIVTDV